MQGGKVTVLPGRCARWISQGPGKSVVCLQTNAGFKRPSF